MDHVRFGVEIEAIVEPHKVRDRLDRHLYYLKLAAALKKRGLSAHAETRGQNYQKHPEYYESSWWITRDGSLGNPTHPGSMSLQGTRFTFTGDRPPSDC